MNRELTDRIKLPGNFEIHAAPGVMAKRDGETICLYSPTHHLHADIPPTGEFTFEDRSMTLDDFTDCSRLREDTRVRMYRHAFLKPHPLFSSINIEVTRNCTLNCPHCFIPQTAERGNSRSPGKEVLDFLEKKRPAEISLTGGELFLDKNLPEFIKRINSLYKTSSPHLRLLANGTWYQERQRAEEFIKEITSTATTEMEFRFTLFDFRGSYHDLICGSSGNFRSLMKITDFLQKMNIPVSHNLTLTSYNFDKRHDAVENLQPASVSSIIYPSLHAEGAAAQLQVSPKQFKVLLNEKEFRSLAAQYTDPSRQCRYHCSFPMLDASGNLYQCNLPDLRSGLPEDISAEQSCPASCKGCPAEFWCKKCPSAVPSFKDHYCPSARAAVEKVSSDTKEKINKGFQYLNSSPL